MPYHLEMVQACFQGEYNIIDSLAIIFTLMANAQVKNFSSFHRFPKGTKDFWDSDGPPLKMWEIVACPVADVTAFLENPLRCMFGLNEESQSDGNLLDVFSSIDGTAILGAMTDSIVPLAVEFVYNFSGLAWLEKVSSMFELTFLPISLRLSSYILLLCYPT